MVAHDKCPCGHSCFLGVYLISKKKESGIAGKKMCFYFVKLTTENDVYTVQCNIVITR